jgi:hypothetical protein
MWVLRWNLELMQYLQKLLCYGDYHHRAHEEHEEYPILVSFARFVVNKKSLKVLLMWTSPD